jgi:hypothetical protein
MSPERGLAMPYLRVTRYQADRAVQEQLAGLAAEFVAAVRQLPGLQHFHGGIDRAAGQGITIYRFDTEEHARFSPEAIGPVGAKVMATGTQIVSTEIYEVTT